MAVLSFIKEKVLKKTFSSYSLTVPLTVQWYSTLAYKYAEPKNIY